MHKHYQMMAHVNILIFLVFVEVIVQFKGLLMPQQLCNIYTITGTYAESLTIDKSISLWANRSVLLDVSGLVTGISILEDVNNVLIDGLSITVMVQQEAVILALLMLQSILIM